MTRAANLLKQVEARGAVVVLGGSTGALVAPACAVEDLLPMLRQHRDAIVRELRKRDGARWRTEYLALGERLGWPTIRDEQGHLRVPRGRRAWTCFARAQRMRVERASGLGGGS